MDITAKNYNLLRLWIESFVTTNKCTGQYIKVGLCLLVLFVAIMAVVGIGLNSLSVVQNFSIGSFQQILKSGAFALSLAGGLFINIFSLFAWTIQWQIAAAHLQQRKRPLVEVFSAAVWPTLCMIAVFALFWIPLLVLGFFTSALVMLSPILYLLIMLLIALFAVRLCYVAPAVMVDHKGPIEAIIHSWNLTSGTDYLDALGMGVISFLSTLFIEVLLILLIYAAYVGIPLYFPNSFNLAHPSLIWWLIALVIGVLTVFYFVSIWNYPLHVYLNRNAMQTGPAPAEKSDEIFIPLPELDNPAPANVQPTLQPEASTQQAAVVQHADPNQSQKMETLDMSSLGIKNTSVNMTETDTHAIDQHLNQVYTQKPEEVIQQAEEDRMPTIVFDDDLAKQLEKDVHNVQEPPKPNTNPGDDSVHLSK